MGSGALSLAPDFPRRGRETDRRSVMLSSKRRTRSRSVKLRVRGDDGALRTSSSGGRWRSRVSGTSVPPWPSRDPPAVRSSLSRCPGRRSRPHATSCRSGGNGISLSRSLPGIDIAAARTGRRRPAAPGGSRCRSARSTPRASSPPRRGRNWSAAGSSGRRVRSAAAVAAGTAAEAGNVRGRASVASDLAAHRSCSANAIASASVDVRRDTSAR